MQEGGTRKLNLGLGVGRGAWPEGRGQGRPAVLTQAAPPNCSPEPAWLGPALSR